MTGLLSFMTALWLSAAGAAGAGIPILTPVVQGVAREGAAVVDPFAKTVISAASSQCDLVKRFFQVSYESYEGEEPDLSKLNLNFITSSVTFTYYLSEAATHISESKWLNYSNPLHIYLHGFTDNPTKTGYTNVSRSFLKQGDFNIIALDASSLIKWLYLRSSTMVRFIGEELAGVLAALYKGGLDPSNIHLIGHSLGSHIAGFAGKEFFELTGKKVGRISSLDPAGPCFTKVNETHKLQRTDADFVDVIHTDAGVFGLNENVGHVDFYPNSGSQQPNCMIDTCSHSRAWEMYAESVVDPDAFIGVSCESWQQFRDGACDTSNTSVMGFACPKGTTGTYYLQTAGEYPFGLGAEGLTFNNNEGIVRTLGAKAVQFFQG